MTRCDCDMLGMGAIRIKERMESSERRRGRKVQRSGSLYDACTPLGFDLLVDRPVSTAEAQDD